MVEQFDHLMVRQIYNNIPLEQQQKFRREARARAKRKRDSAQPQEEGEASRRPHDDSSERDEQRAHTKRNQVA